MELALGIVLPKLLYHREIVHSIVESPFTEGFEFTYRYPVYKGTKQLEDWLPRAKTALEKFDIYFDLAILDEKTRVKLSAAFRERYLRQFPRSERSDIFTASADVFSFSFTLKCPPDADDLDIFPHDDNVLLDFKRSGNIAKKHRTAELRLFLDHIHNPRRKNDPEVVKCNLRDPVVIELVCDGALPGLFYRALEPVATDIGGDVVLLETTEERNY